MLSYLEFLMECLNHQPVSHYHKHHIIPRCLGGSDDEKNLIKLSYSDHWWAHKLLADENPKNEQLVHAHKWMGKEDDYVKMWENKYYGPLAEFKRITRKYKDGNPQVVGSYLTVAELLRLED